jgi:hypothetical protein
MNAAIILGTIGTIVTILGTIFHLQGQSVVGPESSFMYANPEWITYGIQVGVVGIVIIVIAIIVRIIKK